MEVILLEKVGKLGALGDRVTVKGGYARNFLLPQGRAVLANEANIAEFEARRAELEKTPKSKSMLRPSCREFERANSYDHRQSRRRR